MTKDVYKEYIKNAEMLSDKKGINDIFFTSTKSLDRLLLSNVQKSASMLEKKLGKTIGEWKNINLVRIDIPFDFKFSPKVPSGFEKSATEMFKYGGATLGGMPEITFRNIPVSKINVTDLGVFQWK